MKHLLLIAGLVLLPGCGSITLPAAARLADGTALIGTTTASMAGGSFQLSSSDKKITCSGTYDAMDMSPTINLPVACSNGLYGNAVVTRSADGMSGYGNAIISDGTTAQIAFGNNAGTVVASSSAVQSASVSGSGAGVGSSSGVYSDVSLPGRTYSGNCPTPDSLDAAGRRCGARSAASRPGGYSGYGSWSRPSYSSGSTYVRSYTRKNGTRVRGHYRRR